MELRAYTGADRAVCLAIFDSNLPAFFAQHERDEFARFLDTQQTAPYFVVETDGDGQVVACGGYFRLPHVPAAVLTWGMVARDHQKQGIGRFLLLRRLQRLCQAGGVTLVKLQTSQHTCGFFAKYGFVTEKIIEDGYVPGLHLYNMGLRLDEARCSSVLADCASSR